MKSTLVTGGAGFLGCHLCDRLMAGGARVVCLDNFVTGFRGNIAHLLDEPRFTLIERDVCEPLDSAVIERIGLVGRIYNLACPASPPMYQRDPVFTMRTSVLGALRMLDLAQRTGARILQASTSEVYGDPAVHPQPESYRGNVNPIGPRACYDEGKRAAETLFFDYHRAGRADIRVVRIFNTYGPRMHPDDGRVVSNFIRQALAGEDLTIQGDGAQTRAFCYVDDLIDGLIAMMENTGGGGAARAAEFIGPVNLGNPEELAVLDLAGLVIELTGSTSRPVFAPACEDDPARRKPDITCAQDLLGWRPVVGAREGLTRTIDWFRSLDRAGYSPGPAAGSAPCGPGERSARA